jgi:hypothetical protein
VDFVELDQVSLKYNEDPSSLALYKTSFADYDGGDRPLAGHGRRG